MIASWIGLVGDGLIVVGVLVVTVAAIGLLRMPDSYLCLHASGKAVVLGDAVIAVASIATGDPAIIARCLLIALFLLLTTPVATHAIAYAAWRENEPLGGDRPVDESRAWRHGSAPPP